MEWVQRPSNHTHTETNSFSLAVGSESFVDLFLFFSDPEGGCALDGRKRRVVARSVDKSRNFS